MTFITRCPYPECRKYMLLEDRDRGTTVDCLCCKRPINLNTDSPGETNSGSGPSPTRSGSSSAPPPRSGPPARQDGAAAPASPATAPAQPYQIRHCPQCNTAMRVPPTTAGQAVQCPSCQHVF
jgi:hypothetical protein